MLKIIDSINFSILINLKRSYWPYLIIRWKTTKKMDQGNFVGVQLVIVSILNFFLYKILLNIAELFTWSKKISETLFLEGYLRLLASLKVNVKHSQMQNCNFPPEGAYTVDWLLSKLQIASTIYFKIPKQVQFDNFYYD